MDELTAESMKSTSCSPAVPLKCSGVLGKSLALLFLSFLVFKDVQAYHHTWVLQELINYHLHGFEGL